MTGNDIPYGYCHCGCGSKTSISPRKKRDLKKGEPAHFISGHNNRNRKPNDLVDRFWNKVTVLGLDECWEWKTYRMPFGYGLFKVGNWMHIASRVAYRLTRGEIPDGLQVLHVCDNPPCCNPTHLFVGTRSDNMQDMHNKQRHRASIYKLDGEKAAAIRLDTRSYVNIAKEYGVSTTTIWKVKNGQTYNKG